MNGFVLMAESFRRAAGEGKINVAEAEKQARLYDFLETCDQDDLYLLFDSTAFNEIAKSYMRAAVKHLVNNGTLDEEQGKAVRNEFSFLFSEKNAKGVSED